MAMKKLDPLQPSLLKPTTDIDIASVSPGFLQEKFDQCMEILSDQDFSALAVAANQLGHFQSFFVHRFYEYPSMVLNPTITQYGPPIAPLPEECLSVQGVFYPLRHEWVKCSYWEYPSMVQYENRIITGYEAVMFEHECDHLNGITLNYRVQNTSA